MFEEATIVIITINEFNVYQQKFIHVITAIIKKLTILSLKFPVLRWMRVNIYVEHVSESKTLMYSCIYSCRVNT